MLVPFQTVSVDHFLVNVFFVKPLVGVKVTQNLSVLQTDRENKVSCCQRFLDVRMTYCRERLGVDDRTVGVCDDGPTRLTQTHVHKSSPFRWNGFYSKHVSNAAFTLFPSVSQWISVNRYICITWPRGAEGGIHLGIVCDVLTLLLVQ